MHVHEPTTAGAEPLAVLLQAVKETTRSACHLADVAARAPPAAREGSADAAAQASLEAGLRASRALFSLEDALATREEGPALMVDALTTLAAAEDAVRAARAAIETRVSRSIRPDVSAGATAWR